MDDYLLKNTTTDYSDDGSNDSAPVIEPLLWYRYDLMVGTALAIAYGLVFIVGLIGNVLVLVAVFSGGRSMRHSVTNIFLANLAVADLLVIIACLPFTLISNLIYPWILGATICKLLPYLQGVSVCASVYSLVAVAVERCRTVTVPLHQRLTVQSCRKIIAIIWIAAALITAPWLFVFQQQSVIGENFLFCIEMWRETWMEATFFFVAHLLLCYVVPLFIIVVSYALVGRGIWRREVPSFHLSDEVQARVFQLQQSKYRALWVIAVVVAAFAVTWFPFYVTFTRINYHLESIIQRFRRVENIGRIGDPNLLYRHSNRPVDEQRQQLHQSFHLSFPRSAFS